VGRLPVVVVFDELTKEDLVEILKNPNNPIILSKRLDFKAYGIDIKFEEEALVKLAEAAAKEKTGARGLVSAIERVLIPFEKHLPSTPIKRLLVTAELVDNPEAELKRLKEDSYDAEMRSRFEAAARRELESVKTYIEGRNKDFGRVPGLEMTDSRRELIAGIYLGKISDVNTAFEDFVAMYHEIKSEEASLAHDMELDVTFDSGAIDELLRRSIATGQDAGSLTFQLAKKLEYGLKLVKDRSGVDHFVVTKDAVLDMDKYINDLVKRYYRKEYCTT
jgi:ATP-dependent Clp protease ATP-binding subunit ClpX